MYPIDMSSNVSDSASGTTVEIQYCVPCGHLPRAIDVQRSILERFGRKLDGVKLKTGEGGIFKVRIDGDEIYSSPEEFSLEAVIGDIQKRI